MRSSEFMSRKGIEFGSITLHPDGIPHGPHPGRAEASIGAKDTDELAVMMDTFRPLKVAEAGARDRGQGLRPLVAPTGRARMAPREAPLNADRLRRTLPARRARHGGGGPEIRGLR